MKTIMVCIYTMILFFSCQLHSQNIPVRYHSYEEMTKDLKTLAEKFKSSVTLSSLGTTLNKHEIWLLTIGAAPDKNKAIVIAGGVEGDQIIGSEYVLRYASALLEMSASVDSIKQILAKTTIYFLPRVNPDATESFFEKPLRERVTNFRPYDDDRDGAIDEDDAEDLDGNGIITMMRVKDPQGEWMIHPDEPRLMKKADPAKGEKGIYRLYSEGIDNDGDEEWNEDGAGGTDFNRNFAYNYEYFGKQSGLHQVSEIETRAVADFIFSHPNISTVFAFSSNDNLTVPWKAEPKRAGGEEQEGQPASVAADDQPYYAFAAKKFSEVTKLSNAPKPAKGSGSFSEWVYYHTGRWSFTVRPWWAPEIAAKKDSSAGKDAEKTGMNAGKSPSAKEEDEYADQKKALKWYDAAGVKDVFIPWKKFNHKDFPGKETEIGGIAPFKYSNPPAESIAVFEKPLFSFMTYLAGALPEISIQNIKTEKIREGIYRIAVDVVNQGYLPTNTKFGNDLKWAKNVYVTLALPKGNTLASGREKQKLSPIKGSGGFEKLEWLIVGKPGSITVKAGSPMTNYSEQTIELR